MKRIIMSSLVVSIVGGIGFFLWQTHFSGQDGYQAEAAVCALLEQDAEVIDCFMRVIEDQYQQYDLTAAVDAFTHIYVTYDVFSDTGCHRHAHRLGDLAYAIDFLTHTDLTRMHFPPETVVCGYGFYHGFIEHLIQNQPTVDFVVQSCNHLIATHQGSKEGMDYSCYHGAGHGFLLAKADTLYEPGDWTVANFTTDALALCEALPVSKLNKSSCYEGLFNVLVDWMVEKNYGLTYDFTDPWSVCDVITHPEGYRACSIEVSRKLGYVTNDNLQHALRLIQQHPDASLHEQMFKINVGGRMQANPKEIPYTLVQECQQFPEPFNHGCLRAAVSGLFHHGATGDEYLAADTLCAESSLSPADRTFCYEQVADKIAFFENETTIDNLCTAGTLASSTCAAWRSSR